MSKVKAYKKQGSQSVAKVAAEKFKGIGRLIVATSIRAENSVRDALIACKGEAPEQLDLVKEGIRTAWQEQREKLYTGKEESPGEISIKMMLQATYNRQSEQLAVIGSFRLYAGMDETLRAEFDREVDECQNYHKLVEFARHVNRAAKGEAMTVAEVAKRKKELHELRANTFKAMEKNLKLASVEQLQALALEIQARLRTLKAPTAPTLSVVKAKARKQISETRAKLVTPKAKQVRKVA